MKSAGGTTAYSDKHTGAYTMLQGANGTGLDQVYNPEQNANGAENITDSQYDMLHVRLSDPNSEHNDRTSTGQGPRTSALAWVLALTSCKEIA